MKLNFELKPNMAHFLSGTAFAIGLIGLVNRPDEIAWGLIVLALFLAWAFK